MVSLKHGHTFFGTFLPLEGGSLSPSLKLGRLVTAVEAMLCGFPGQATAGHALPRTAGCDVHPGALSCHPRGPTARLCARAAMCHLSDHHTQPSSAPCQVKNHPGGGSFSSNWSTPAIWAPHSHSRHPSLGPQTLWSRGGWVPFPNF